MFLSPKATQTGGYADCLQEQRNLATEKAKHRRMLVRIDGISEVRVREALEDLRFSRELETGGAGLPRIKRNPFRERFPEGVPLFFFLYARWAGR